MKAKKIITIITIVLFITILSVSAFVGFYVLKDYSVRNIIPKYKFGKEFSKSRVVELNVDDSVESTKILDQDGNEVTEKQEGVEYTEENGYKTVEEKVNKEEDLIPENYKKAERIIKARLKGLEVEQYNTTLNKDNGTINVELTENDYTDEVIEYLTARGIFQIVDSETQEVLLDNSNIKSVKAGYRPNNNSADVYVQVKFNKDGIKKLNEMSNTYVETKVETTDENGETKEETQSKEFSILLDGQELDRKHFEEGDNLKKGILDIKIGSGTNDQTIQNYLKVAKDRKTVIQKGVLPIEYTQTNSVKDNSINIFEKKAVVYPVIAVIIVAVAIYIIKFKANGILASILEVGYSAALLIMLRLVGIKITTTGVIAIAVAIIINYIYIYKAFKDIDLRFVKDTTKYIAIRTIPVYVIAIVFTFMKNLNISSIGMSLVWGTIVMYLYNLTLTQFTLKTLKNK